jgi:hypothetical protein
MHSGRLSCRKLWMPSRPSGARCTWPSQHGHDAAAVQGLSLQYQLAWLLLQQTYE